MMMVSVFCAFFVVGARKARTPLLTASTPVIAVQPLAKTFKTSHRLIAAVAAGRCGGATTGAGCPWPISARTAPTKMTTSNEPTKR